MSEPSGAAFFDVVERVAALREAVGDDGNMHLPYRECSHERLCQIVEEQLRRIAELEKAVRT